MNLNSCGYSPIYKLNENINFKVTSITFEGDRIINNFLRSKFKKYKGIDSGEEFHIKVNTDYTKKPLSKDATGQTTVYQLQLNMFISVRKVNSANIEDFKEFNKEYGYNEDFLLKNDNDKFEEKSYENEIKQNMADNIYDKFILSLISR